MTPHTRRAPAAPLNHPRSLQRLAALALCLQTAAISVAAGQAPPPAAGTATLPAPATAHIAPGTKADPALLEWLAAQRDNLGRRCELHQVASLGALRFLACGAAGLWTAHLDDHAQKLLGVQDLGGEVSGFFAANAQLWVEIKSVRAQQLALGALEPALADARAVAAPAAEAVQTPPTAASAATPAPSAKAPPTVTSQTQASSAPASDVAGTIVLREDANLVIVRPGPQLPVNTHIAFIGAATTDPTEEVLYAVGEVVRSSPGRARVEIGTNEHVPNHAKARPTAAPLTRATFAPPRAAGVWELAFLARPFLVLGDLGAGALLDANVGYRWQQPFHVQASLTPLGFGSARAGAIAALGAFIAGSYDTRLFEVGLGLGGQTVNEPEFGLNPGSGLLISQLLRLGARDGAHLDFLSYVTLFHSNFDFSGLRVTAQIPLGARTWLRLAGGAGSLGVAFGEVGLRLLTAGNGGPGSLFLTTTIGGTGLSRSCSEIPDAAATCSARDYSGPMIGFGLEFRR